MAEQSKAPGRRNSTLENSGTRVCAWVRIPLLSLNVLNTMRHSLQLTNSLILEPQFKMTVQSKKKQKKIATSSVVDTRAISKCPKRRIPRRDIRNTKVPLGLNANLFKWMTQTVQKITSRNWKNYPMERPQIERKKMCPREPGRMAEGLRSQTQKTPQSRILVHECVRGLESDSCQKTFWTRWIRASNWQILSYWNINSRSQCKSEEKKTTTSSVVDNRAVWNCTKKDTQKRHVKHECTRGFKRKSLQMDDTNCLAE